MEESFADSIGKNTSTKDLDQEDFDGGILHLMHIFARSEEKRVMVDSVVKLWQRSEAESREIEQHQPSAIVETEGYTRDEVETRQNRPLWLICG